MPTRGGGHLGQDCLGEPSRVSQVWALGSGVRGALWLLKHDSSQTRAPSRGWRPRGPRNLLVCSWGCAGKHSPSTSSKGSSPSTLTPRSLETSSVLETIRVLLLGQELLAGPGQVRLVSRGALVSHHEEDYPAFHASHLLKVSEFTPVGGHL